MKKLHKTALGYEKWRGKHGGDKKPWINGELNTLPMVDKNDLISSSLEDSFEEISEDELDETEAEPTQAPSEESDSL